MLSDCKFCNRENFEKRLFWEDKEKGWCAFLSSQPITLGHTIILMISHREGLLEAVDDDDTMKELPYVLKLITKVLSRVYQTKNIMMASMNRGEAHFHIHLYPTHEEELKKWWKKQGIEKGRMLSFLGEKEYLTDEFNKRIWEKCFTKSIHEAADDLIKDLDLLKKVANEIEPELRQSKKD